MQGQYLLILKSFPIEENIQGQLCPINIDIPATRPTASLPPTAPVDTGDCFNGFFDGSGMI